MDLREIEKELKQRWEYPYSWGRKQNDNWDRETNFIYKTYTFKDLRNQIRDCSPELRDYAMNRWYNYWSAKAAEITFMNQPGVIASTNPYNKFEDFRINDIPFDHKTTVFPANFQKSYLYALQNEKELIKWLYRNQSLQGRQHFKNRIFIVLYDSISLQHWKMKAEINLIRQAIEDYTKKFSVTDLQTLSIDNQQILSDIIWIKK